MICVHLQLVAILCAVYLGSLVLLCEYKNHECCKYIYILMCGSLGIFMSGIADWEILV
jgi:hypothetical protein